MSKKTVLVKFGERRKVISFVSVPNRSDLKALQEAFNAVITNDYILKKQNVTSVKSVVFQQYNNDFGTDTDIEEWDCIMDKSQISAIFFHFGDYNNNNNNTSTPAKEYHLPPASATYSMSESEDGLPGPSVPSNTASVGDLDEASRSSRANANFHRYPCPLPNFSPALKKAISKGDAELLNKSHQFVRECSAFLLRNIDKPSAKDYACLARTLAEKYPVFKTSIGINPWSSLSKQMSTCVRNTRYHAKRLSGPLSETSSGKSKRCFEFVHDIVEPGDGDVPQGQTLLQELENSMKNGGRQRGHEERLKTLLKETLSLRRADISGKTCHEVKAKYVIFQKSTWLVNELLLITKADPSEMMQRYEDMLQILCALYEVPLNCELDKLRVILKVYEDTYRAKKVAKPVIMKEAGTNIRFVCSKSQTPILQIYHENGDICAAFIVAQGSLLAQVDDSPLTAFHCTVAMLASYYVFNFQFPPAYRGLLRLLQATLLQGEGAPKRLGNMVSAFFRRYETARNSYLQNQNSSEDKYTSLLTNLLA